MRRILILLLVGALTACGGTTNAVPPTYIVVVNRSDASLSIIDPATDTVVQTVDLPEGDTGVVAGYVVYSSTHQRLYVGDESNHRVIILRASDFSVFGEMPMPSDAFHMWHNDRQLWVVDRRDGSLGVFDMNTSSPLAIVPIPADLAAIGASPHDVVVDEGHAYVTIAGIEDAPDVVVKYSTSTFEEVARANVGEDPHVFMHPVDRRICVACQDTDDVHVLDRDTMATQAVVPIFGGHGVWIPPHGQALYVTNFPGHVVGGEPGPGADGLFTVDLNTHTPLGGIAAPFPAPHNLASTADGTTVYLTHSNGDTKVSVYDVATPTSMPVLRTEINVGKTPFGICRME